MTSFDVILSTFNGARDVEAAVQSVLSQTRKDFLLHIIDDGSIDNTWELLSKFNDVRIRLHKNSTNLGLFSNLNSLVRHTYAPWIKLLGQDDIMKRDCLEQGLSFLTTHPNLGCFWCYCDYINESGLVFARGPENHVSEVLNVDQADRDCLAWGCLSSNISNLFIRRDALASVGPFRCDIMSADFDMMSRIQEKFEIGRLTKKMVLIRSHEKQWGADYKQMENHISGNLEVYSKIFHRAVYERGSISEQNAIDLLASRFARNEFNWALKALQKTGNLKATGRILKRMHSLVPVQAVIIKWSQLMGPRYMSRLSGLTK
jgi:glycosyltransferase involved in cell wall biosynthesis